MATARSGYTLQVIKAGQQGHVEMRWGHLADVDTRAAAAAIMQHIGRSSSSRGQQEISLSLTNAASGISVELHHPASGESTTPAFIEAELKKIVQIVDGYEAAEDTTYCGVACRLGKKKSTPLRGFFCAVAAKTPASGIRR